MQGSLTKHPPTGTFAGLPMVPPSGEKNMTSEYRLLLDLLGSANVGLSQSQNDPAIYHQARRDKWWQQYLVRRMARSSIKHGDVQVDCVVAQAHPTHA